MKIHLGKINLQPIIFLSSCIITILAIYFLTSYWRPTSHDDFFSQFMVNGYNFRKFQTGDSDFAKYKVGDQIDLTELISTDGESLLTNFPEDLLLLNVIDPFCGYCELSKDIVHETKKTKSQIQVAYLPVLFTSLEKEVDLRSYAQRIGFPECYRWKAEYKPPAILVQMPTPAHILVNRNGVILQVWFSSNKDKSIRKIMSDQMSADLRLITDVVRTLR